MMMKNMIIMMIMKHISSTFCSFDHTVIMMGMMIIVIMMTNLIMRMKMKHRSSTFAKIFHDSYSASDVTIWLMLNSHQIVTNQTLDEKPILSISS